MTDKRTGKRTETHACDSISRQAAIDALSTPHGILYPIRTIEQLPSAQPDRDIPIKPAEATETYWGRCVRAAVCPKCDYHLGRVYFLSDGHDIGVRKISDCGTCGQAIDWSEWEDGK